MIAVFVLVGAAGAQNAPTTAPTLKWGDCAPELKIAKWIKGTPVEKFEPARRTCWSSGRRGAGRARRRCRTSD
jgi:hypothetical protein